MSAVKSVTTFGVGTMIGAALGAAIGLLCSPGSGEDVRQRVRGRLDDAKSAGEAAETAKQQELIQKYRLNVRNPDALAAEEQLH